MFFNIIFMWEKYVWWGSLLLIFKFPTTLAFLYIYRIVSNSSCYLLLWFSGFQNYSYTFHSDIKPEIFHINFFHVHILCVFLVLYQLKICFYTFHMKTKIYNSFSRRYLGSCFAASNRTARICPNQKIQKIQINFRS